MSTTSPKLIVPSPVSTPLLPGVPALQNGDHLTRAEFERRYEAMPDVKKAELIEGVVFMPSPVRLEEHGQPHADLMGWLFVYRAQTGGVRAGDNSTVRLDLDNEPQPDAVLFIDPARGGRVKLVNGYIEGAPELVLEVAASSVSIDLHTKLRAYGRNRVQEYLVWRVLDREIDWFVLRSEQYEKMPLSADGLYRSEVFPGLWLDPAALIAADLGKVLQALQQGLSTPEHSSFVAGLTPPPASPQ